MKNISAILFIVFIGSCAKGKVQGDGEPVDLSFPCIEEEDHSFDDANCGRCGNPCVTRSDHCQEGECVCGSSSACSEGQECKLETCVFPERSVLEGGDPDATVCEFDHECSPLETGRYCIEGVCSRVPCGDVLRTQNCYDGPDGTQNHSPCHEGYMVCREGYWSECKKQVLPIPEVGGLLCDRVDNNCDGCKDGEIVDDVCIPIGIRDVDILFVMDQSGSMGWVCQAVKEAMRSVGGRFDGNNRYRLGIVTIPHSDWSCEPGIYQNFSIFYYFQRSLDSLVCDVGGDEASWDAVYLAASDGEFYDVNSERMARLSWRDDSTRVIIMFTDEQGQSWNQEGKGICHSGSINEAAMCEVVDDEVLAVVTSIASHATDFDECGYIYELLVNSTEMAANLESILEEACAD